METKKEQLLLNVKYAVQKYRMDGVTVKNISEVCNVNDSHLHRFYKNKEELLLEAYKRESGTIFRSIIRYLDETENVPLDFRSRVRLFFHWTWKELLSDPARLAFCMYFYHSSCFEMAEDFHVEQTEKLCERFMNYFDNKEACFMTVNTLMTVLYENAKLITDEGEENSAEKEEMVFVMLFTLAESQIDSRKSQISTIA